MKSYIKRLKNENNYHEKSYASLRIKENEHKFKLLQKKKEKLMELGISDSKNEKKDQECKDEDGKK